MKLHVQIQAMISVFFLENRLRAIPKILKVQNLMN
jgi:hypothetical protein